VSICQRKERWMKRGSGDQWEARRVEEAEGQMEGSERARKARMGEEPTGNVAEALMHAFESKERNSKGVEPWTLAHGKPIFSRRISAMRLRAGGTVCCSGGMFGMPGFLGLCAVALSTRPLLPALRKVAMLIVIKW